MSVESTGRVRVLIVEDNPADVMLIRMALKEHAFVCDLEIAQDGAQAIDRLCGLGGYSEPYEPDLILLDLNLPKRSGIEVLQAIRGRECLLHSRVVILSSSPEDVVEQSLRNSNLVADCYLTKPPSLDEFLKVGRLIRDCFESASAR